MVYKPKTKKNYYDLVNSQKIKNFFLDASQIKKAKLLLFLREEVFFLKKEFNGTEIYRNDSLFKKGKNFNSMLKKIDNNKIYFEKLGNFLKTKPIQSVRKKYLDLFDNKKKFN
jgi:hypothetical protein